jgi:hypothetical protein
VQVELQKSRQKYYLPTLRMLVKIGMAHDDLDGERKSIFQDLEQVRVFRFKKIYFRPKKNCENISPIF